ncbi:Fatty acid desaturase [Abortiporus biennis]
MVFNSPEYEARRARPFVPPKFTLSQIHNAVPKHLLQKNALLSLGLFGLLPLPMMPWQASTLQGFLWVSYWWWQGLVFTSFFCIAHELGHESLFYSQYANNFFGLILDTFILVPFFAWKASHNSHHRTVGSIERDNNYVPPDRKEFTKLPPKERATTADYAEVLDETPIMSLVRLFIMQGFGWWLYLGVNAMGGRAYPPGTNHFSPYSALFTERQRRGIIISDIALSVMASILIYFGRLYGLKAFLAFYFVPYVLCNHWIVMCTYLHHSDPTLPHYRQNSWSFLRGAAATVDRPILGWMGRFFFHNVSHDHVAHHFFSQAPFYNQPQITEAIKAILKEDYNYDTTNSFYALYRSFTELALKFDLVSN